MVGPVKLIGKNGKDREDHGHPQHPEREDRAGSEYGADFLPAEQPSTRLIHL
jgi:hypothetical protein